MKIEPWQADRQDVAPVSRCKICETEIYETDAYWKTPDGTICTACICREAAPYIPFSLHCGVACK